MAKNSLSPGAARAAKSLQERMSRAAGVKSGGWRGSLEEVALRNAWTVPMLEGQGQSSQPPRAHPRSLFQRKP